MNLAFGTRELRFAAHVLFSAKQDAPTSVSRHAQGARPRPMDVVVAAIENLGLAVYPDASQAGNGEPAAVITIIGGRTAVSTAGSSQVAQEVRVELRADNAGRAVEFSRRLRAELFATERVYRIDDFSTFYDEAAETYRLLFQFSVIN